MQAVRSLRDCCLPGTTLPLGLVLVAAPNGVALERWMPVFMQGKEKGTQLFFKA